MKKRKTKQQKTIDKVMVNVYNLLETAETATNESVADRFYIHHCLLDMIPSLEFTLNNNGFTRTNDVIEQIKITAEKLASASDLGCYT